MTFASNSKLARIREAMAADKWELAIKLAARFPSLGEQAADIRRANDAINNPRLYEQLGREIEEVRAKGITALKERFSKSWQNLQRSAKSVPRRTATKGD